MAPGPRVIVQGRPNRFGRVGRPTSLFAPKSARLVRWLLMHPEQAISQREPSRATEIDKGIVSRLAARLEADSYVVREASGALRVKDPALVLDAWNAEYRFDRHTLLQGGVTVRSGDALTRFVGDPLAATNVEHAATGLSAAWQLSRVAAFRIATFFIEDPRATSCAQSLASARNHAARTSGSCPNDVGVLQGSAEHGGVRCVHSVQAYVDSRTHVSGLILMPRYQSQGEDGYFIVREVRRVWLKVSEWLRRAGAPRLLPHLPGVSRDPAVPGRLLVEPTLARSHVAEVMHLCGYRHRRSSEGGLVYSRQRLKNIQEATNGNRNNARAIR